MACCDLRILSLIVAWLNTVGAVLGALCCVVLLCCIDSAFVKEMEDYDELRGALLAVFAVVLILCCISFAICVMLIVGINQNRSKLMAPYVYLACIGIVLGILGTVGQFIFQLVAKQAAGVVFVSLFRNFLYVAFEVLFLSPIYLLYQKIRSCPVLPEHHSLSNNEPLNKPHYMHGGHI